MNQVIHEGNTHQKYDRSLEDRISMYDNQPYSKDPDICGSDKIKLVSGNVMKYYTFQYVAGEPYVVNTQDEKVNEKIKKMQMELEKKSAKANMETNIETNIEPGINAEATADAKVIS